MSVRLALSAPALVASAFALTAPAQATSFTGNGSNTIIEGNGAFYDTAIPKGLFTDTITFNVSSVGTADVSVIYFKVIKGITDISASFNGAKIDFTPLGGNLFAGGIIGKSVTPGLQTISVTGTSGGVGSYSGTVSFSAVPELATWLMMIAGVGFTGLALRKRKPGYKVTYAF